MSDLTQKEHRRQKFAFYLRRFNSHYLKRIAESYDIVSQALTCSESFIVSDLNLFRTDILHEDLKRVQMKGCVINGRRITYKQAEFIYELILGGKYGGYYNDGKPLKPLAIPDRSKIINNNSLEETTDF